MRYFSANSGIGAGNPIANVLVVIVGAIAIATSIVVGFLAFVVLGSVLVVFAAIVGLRVWWLGRKTERRAQTPGRNRPNGDQATIEGEYTLIGEDRDET